MPARVRIKASLSITKTLNVSPLIFTFSGSWRVCFISDIHDVDWLLTTCSWKDLMLFIFLSRHEQINPPPNPVMVEIQSFYGATHMTCSRSLLVGLRARIRIQVLIQAPSPVLREPWHALLCSLWTTVLLPKNVLRITVRDCKKSRGSSGFIPAAASTCKNS